MPTLPDYPGVSRIQTESPGLPYGSPNLPDSKESTYFGRVLAFSGAKNGIFDAFLWLNQPSHTFRVEKVKLMISRISIFLGWHL